MITAVTGGIAEGKSTVLGYLSDLGRSVISADAIARDVFNNPEFNRLLAQAAGLSYPLTPQELRQAITSDPEMRRSVNRITHPEIMRRIYMSHVEFVEIPLLIETCLQGKFDQIWVVTCGPEEQRKRLIARYGQSNEIDRMLVAQLPTTAKTPFADEVFRTNYTPETVRRNVSIALARRSESG